MKNTLKYETYQEASLAAQALGIKSSAEYAKNYKLDPRLPARPNFTFWEKGWIDWYQFLGIETKYSHDEASKVAIELGATSRSTYESITSQDPRLPRNAENAYRGKGWVSWFHFLGKEKKQFYKTYQEASKAAINLGITGAKDYQNKYKVDPLLPSEPNNSYKSSGWENWEKFLGVEERYTYEQASKTAIALGITSSIDYRQKYKNDSRLPSTPSDTYINSGWVDWPVFLGKDSFYPYEEASNAAIELGISSSSDYRKKYKNDTKLPSSPQDTYKNKGWVNWQEFLEGRKIRYQSYEEASKAAISLGIGSQPNYQKLRKEDPLLPADPSLTYKHDGWIYWNHFLGKGYDYEEASKVAIQLGAKTLSEYKSLCGNDPKLPRSPQSVYKGKGWVNWYKYLGKGEKNFYETIEEASKAAIALKMISSKDYEERRSEDPRLPTQPARYYSKNFETWAKFLNYEYMPYQEAVKFLANEESRVADTLAYAKFSATEPLLPPSKFVTDWPEFYDWYNLFGLEYKDPLDALALIKAKGESVKCRDSYLELRSLYGSLPEDPLLSYGFSSFEEFLTFTSEQLWSTKDVRTYCFENKIDTKEVYLKHALKHPRLPNQIKQIRGAGSWSQVYYKSDFPMLDNEDLMAWHTLANDWIKSLKTISNRIGLLRNFFEFNKLFLTKDPSEFCNQNEQNDFDINEWVKNLANSMQDKSSIKKMRAFFDFVMEKTCAHVCEESGEVVYFEGYNNPIQEREIIVDLDFHVSLDESNKGMLPFRYIERARHYFLSNNIDNRPKNLGELYHRLDEPLQSRSEWFEVEESVIDQSDPNCIWKKYKGVFWMWSPVRAVATLTQLYNPFRGSQICWLDSGEADTHLLVKVDDGYQWKANELLTEYRVPFKKWQGFVKPSEALNNQQPYNATVNDLNGHVNTNKTAANAFIGYDIPWMDDDLIPWLLMLRDWQIKYNPISRPTRWNDEFKRSKVSESDLKKYGHAGRSCFLFRDPTAGRSRPLAQTKLAQYFACVLYMIQDDEFPLAYLDDKAKKVRKVAEVSISNVRAYYTLHSMRVSLITAYIRDAKIAPEIVQKLVGHSSLVMTIYYTKVTAEEIRDELRSAEERIINNQTNRVEQLIRQRKMEEAKSELIGNDGEIVSQDWSNVPSSAFSIMDSGMCPNGRTRCHDGGEQIEQGKKIVFGPVPAGYLGTSNCLRCRHFCTGYAFLGGLQMLANEISFECKSKSEKIEEIREEITLLEHEEYQAIKAGGSFRKAHTLALAESHYEQAVTDFDNLSCDLISVVRLSINSIELLNRKIDGKSSSNSLSMITTSESENIQLQFGETSEFLHADMICQSSSFYQSARPKVANLNRAQLLDLFARKNGLSPGMFALNERQQIEIGNEMVRFLKARLGSWGDVSALMDKDNNITLEELGFNDKETNTGLKLLLDGKSIGNAELGHKPQKKKKVGMNNE